jgi:N-acetylglucosaminyldiphosphoundecaprenol N-acetyl-beta-D-mannosaminyltransferase
VVSRRILGVRVDAVSYEEVFARVREAVRLGAPRQVVTINTEMLMMARRDELLRRLIDDAHLVVPDGVGLLWAGRLLGRPLKERVTGSDLLPRLCALAADEGWRPFFLGAAPGIAATAANRLAAAIPGLRVAGSHSGSPRPDEEAEIAHLVRQAAPELLFVAYGVPAEEKWLARNLRRLGVPVAIGVGAAIDFAAGVVPRAPQWMRHASLEWLHRLYLQPWRWRRMLALPRFALLVLAAAIAARLGWRSQTGEQSL